MTKECLMDRVAKESLLVVNDYAKVYRKHRDLLEGINLYVWPSGISDIRLDAPAEPTIASAQVRHYRTAEELAEVLRASMAQSISAPSPSAAPQNALSTPSETAASPAGFESSALGDSNQFALPSDPAQEGQHVEEPLDRPESLQE